MEISDLREFLVLAETRNYWEAGERLYISESTLSKHISRLEKELGVPLFLRTTRRVALTPYGEKLVPCARTILNAQLSFQETLKAMKEASAGALLLGVIPSMVQYGITDLIARFHEKYPEISVRIMENDTAELQEQLKNGRAGLAFLRESDAFPVDPDEFAKIAYLKETAVAVLPAVHPLANAPEIALSALSAEHFIMLQETSRLREVMTDACMKQGFRPDVIFECRRMDSIFDLVSRNMGVSLVMEHHVDHSCPGLAFVPLSPALESRIFLCCKKNSRLNRAEELFIQELKHTAAGAGSGRNADGAL